MTAHIEMKSSESEAPLIGDMVKAYCYLGLWSVKIRTMSAGLLHLKIEILVFLLYFTVDIIPLWIIIRHIDQRWWLLPQNTRNVFELRLIFRTMGRSPDILRFHQTFPCQTKKENFDFFTRHFDQFPLVDFVRQEFNPWTDIWNFHRTCPESSSDFVYSVTIARFKISDDCIFKAFEVSIEVQVCNEAA